MQLNNVRRIVVEDYKQDHRETVAKLAEILNSFMEEVTQLSQGNIGIENLTRNIVKFDLIVDALGNPMGVSQMNIGLSSYSGKNIIDIQSLSGGANVISAPYLDCSYQGNGLVKIHRFLGLPPGKKVRITIEFIG